MLLTSALPDHFDPPTLRGATTTHRIAASILTARARYERGDCCNRGLSRASQTQVGSKLQDGNVVVEGRNLPDLLGHYLGARAPGADEGARRRLDFQLETSSPASLRVKAAVALATPWSRVTLTSTNGE